MTMEIIRPALVALVNAYKTRHAGAPMMPDDDVLTRSILQQIQNPDGAKQLGLVLDDAAGDGCIKPSALIALIQCALQVEDLKFSLFHSEKEANAAWGAISSAQKILRKRGEKGTADYALYGTAHLRHSAALYELGLIGEKYGEGRGRRRYEVIAKRYFHLRTGGYAHQNGQLNKTEPHTHDEAVSAIFTEFQIDWASLQRAWRRHGIKVVTKAEVFPKS